ncbi:MAG: hypothetical protein KF886_17560, partial [Candidatus Hydrogenedentes bacterium]|nr:hypothetical protein [Candidatus Hydrogenedentota bacterium]
MAIPHGQWREVVIEIGGEEGASVTVKHLRAGETEVDTFEADTTLTNASTDIGFGVGERADYLFDDVRF